MKTIATSYLYFNELTLTTTISEITSYFKPQTIICEIIMNTEYYIKKVVNFNISQYN